MTHVTCRLTAKNRDQLRNPTLGKRVRATFLKRSDHILSILIVATLAQWQRALCCFCLLTVWRWCRSRRVEWSAESQWHDVSRQSRNATVHWNIHTRWTPHNLAAAMRGIVSFFGGGEAIPLKSSRNKHCSFAIATGCYFENYFTATVHPNSGPTTYIAATTAEKVGGTSRGVGAEPLPFTSPSLPHLAPLLLPPMFQPFPSILLFPSPLKFSKEVWGSTVSFLPFPAKKWHPVAKVRGDQIHSVPVISKVGGGRVPSVPYTG